MATLLSNHVEPTNVQPQLVDLIEQAAPEQVTYALSNERSPLYSHFYKFLAIMYSDWLITHQNYDEKKLQKDWEIALTSLPKNGSYGRDMEAYMNDRLGDDVKSPDSDDSSDLDLPVAQSPATEDEHSLAGSEDYDHDKYFMTAIGLRIKMKEKDPLSNVIPIFDAMNFPPRGRGSGIDAADLEAARSSEGYSKLPPEKMELVKAKLPLLADTRSPQTREDLICRKLKLCEVVFDFNSTSIAEIKLIEKKKAILTEILEYVARFNWYSETVLKACFKTIGANLFRALPSPARPEDESEPFEDKCWPHLQLVYDLTLRLVICTDVDKKIMKKYLEGDFVNNVIELFASDDNREREYLKTILHRIYGRFMPLRGVIRSAISSCCYRTVYTTARSENGIAEFLEIFCSIIHGFSIPVKEEHKEFLRNVLVPLHKCRKLEKFHEQLVACCVQFVFKDATVAPVILGGLLRFWPQQSPIKEEMFITELINIISALLNHKNGFEWDDYKVILLSVVDKVVECMTCGHHQVAERAVALWMEESMELLADQDREAIWIRLAAAFEKNQEHWNVNLRQTNEEVLEHMRSRDPDEWAMYERKVKERMDAYRDGYYDIPGESNPTIDRIVESKDQRETRIMEEREGRNAQWAILLKMKEKLDKEREEVRSEVFTPPDPISDDELVDMFQEILQTPGYSSDDFGDDTDDELEMMNGGGSYSKGAEPVVYGNGTNLDVPATLSIPPLDDDEKERLDAQAARSRNVVSPASQARSSSPSRRTRRDGVSNDDDESDHPRRRSREDARSRSPAKPTTPETENTPTKRTGRSRTSKSSPKKTGPPRSPGRTSSNRQRKGHQRTGSDRSQNKSRPSRPASTKSNRSRMRVKGGIVTYAE